VQVRIDGEFLAADEYDFQGAQGFTISILQETASAKVSCRKEDAPTAWPDRMTPVEIEAVIQPGFENRGFKARVKSFRAKGETAARPLRSASST
jgi:hypothetical protein